MAKLFDELLLMTAGPGRAIYNGKMEDSDGTEDGAGHSFVDDLTIF